MKKILMLAVMLLSVSGCSANEVQQSEAVEKVFNTEVIEHTAELTMPESSIEETSDGGLGSITLEQFKPEESSEVQEETSKSDESESVVKEQSFEAETVVVPADINETQLPEDKQIELNDRLPIEYKDGIWTYELKESESLLKEDSFKDVMFFFILEDRRQAYPGTIEAVDAYKNDLKEMIILFYRQASNSAVNELIYKEVGAKEMNADIYKEWMDIYEDGKQRMRVELLWDKLNNKALTISFSMIEGTEGEVIEDS